MINKGLLKFWKYGLIIELESQKIEIFILDFIPNLFIFTKYVLENEIIKSYVNFHLLKKI